MQYANDITPLTLTSTAQLRMLLNPVIPNNHLERSAMERELFQRIPNYELEFANDKIEELQDKIKDARRVLE